MQRKYKRAPRTGGPLYSSFPCGQFLHRQFRYYLNKRVSGGCADGREAYPKGAEPPAQPPSYLNYSNNTNSTKLSNNLKVHD